MDKRLYYNDYCLWVYEYVSEDPIRYGSNWYVFANNNPLKFIDPWGLAPIAIKDFVKNKGGSFGWNDDTRSSWFTIGIKTLRTLWTGANLDGIYIWNDNGTMMADDVALYKFFGIPIGSGLSSAPKSSGAPTSSSSSSSSSSSGSGMFAKGAYAEGSGPQIKNGIELGKFEAGVAKIGDNGKVMNWAVSADTIDAQAGFTTEYVGAQLGARLIKVEGGFKLPIPYTEKSLLIGGEGDLFGVGFKSFIDPKSGTMTIGVTAVVGGNVTVGIVDR